VTPALPEGYTITGDRGALDLAVAHRALSEDSYWARGRTREVTEQAFAASRVAVALAPDGATAAFARAVTDGVTFAGLCDVWVEPAHRGRGLGKAVVQFLVDAPELAGLRRWTLATQDAHGLYAQIGFETLEHPERWMERRGAVT
jgi:GNAT superfamily N-acetyltransferase